MANCFDQAIGEKEDGLMAKQSMEERLTSLEKQSAARLTSLEQEVKELKAELAKRRTLEGLRTDVQELQVRYGAHEEYVTERLNDFEAHMTEQMNELKGNVQEVRAGQQGLQAGQEQILAILTGKAKTND